MFDLRTRPSSPLGLAATTAVLLLLTAGCGEVTGTKSVDKQKASDGVLLATVTLEGVGACAGIPVVLETPDGTEELTTDGGGALRAGGLAAGAYSLSIEADGWLPVEKTVIYEAADPKDLGDLTLKLETVPVQGSVALSPGST